jgi:hypothetical protein
MAVRKKDKRICPPVETSSGNFSGQTQWTLQWTISAETSNGLLEFACSFDELNEVEACPDAERLSMS